MKAISINLYQFDELSHEAQQTAVEVFRDINLHPEWWDFVFEDFCQLCQYLGLTIDLKRTYFSGFYHQGQGSSYTAGVNVLKLLNGVKQESWKEYAPREVSNFPAFSLDSRIYKLVQSNVIALYCRVTPSNRETAIDVIFEADYTLNRCSNYINIDLAMAQLESWVTDICEELNAILFRMLEKEYDYRLSDEAVKDSIRANQFDFREDGSWF